MSKAKVVVKEKPAWYKQLIEDLKAIIEKERTTIIRLKHEIGKRILAERERAKLEFGEITKFMKDLGYEVGYSWQELYACMKFAEKYPDIDSFLMVSEKLSWMKIVHEMLYERPEVEKAPKIAYVYTHEDWTCSICGAMYKLMHARPDKHKIELIEEGRE